MNQNQFISHSRIAYMDGESYQGLKNKVGTKCQQEPKKQLYDVIVLGVGSMGASTCYHLAKRGLSVLGLEQFNIPHELGSHTGQSRIIRKAYGEESDYVPLLEKAYLNWKTLESESGWQVYFPNGLLYMGPAESSFLNTVLKSAKKYDICINRLTSAECRIKHPAFHLPEDFTIIEEPNAGFLTPERAILVMADLATQYGADISMEEKAKSWKRKMNEIQVETNKGSYRAKKLIITGGAWTNKMLLDLHPPLKVTRQLMAWVQPRNPKVFELGNFPCWMLENGHNHFYGFPALPSKYFQGPQGLKLALHHPVGKGTDPDKIDRTYQDAELQILMDFIKEFMPEGFLQLSEVKTCIYTNSPDHHFIMDFLPGHDQKVVLATGFSGHGFKFASVVGEILADLAIQGKTDLPIEFLRLSRFK